MKEYIFNHPGINLLFIEKYANMPQRSLRKDRSIPEKFIPFIKECLIKYYSYKALSQKCNIQDINLSQECATVDNTSVSIPKDKINPNIFRCDKLGFYYLEGTIKRRPQGNETKEYQVFER